MHSWALWHTNWHLGICAEPGYCWEYTDTGVVPFTLTAYTWGRLLWLCRLSYIWQRAWCNLSDVQPWVSWFEPTDSEPSPHRPGSLTEKNWLNMWWAELQEDSGAQTHTHTQTHFQLQKRKKRQLCSLWIIRARAEPRRQSLASWEQGSPDEASLFKSSGWAASVSVDGIAPGDMHKLGGRISQESGSEKKDGETDGDRKV